MGGSGMQVKHRIKIVRKVDRLLAVEARQQAACVDIASRPTCNPYTEALAPSMAPLRRRSARGVGSLLLLVTGGDTVEAE